LGFDQNLLNLEMALGKFGKVLQILERQSPHRHFRRDYYLYSPEPIHPLPDRKPDWKTADEALQVVQSGETFLLFFSSRFINASKTVVQTVIFSLYQRDKTPKLLEQLKY
jgi:hypothetical protein